MMAHDEIFRVSRIHPVETTNVSKIIFQCGVNLYHDENWYFVLHF